jgi:hypothetical protein
MIRWSAGRLGIDPDEAELGQIEFVDKDVDHANRAVLADPIFQAFRKQRALPAIRPLNEALHPIAPQTRRESYRAIHMKRGFSHSQGQGRKLPRRRRQVSSPAA